MKVDEHIQIQKQANGDFQITWTDDFTTSPVSVYVSHLPDAEHRGELVHSNATTAAEVAPLGSNRRHYFHLLPEAGRGVTVGERVISLREGMNFRDFGGYHTEDGRQVQWGRLYRSGHLSGLDEQGRDYLQSLGIRTNCDFRLTPECDANPNQLPGDTQVVSLNVDAGNFASFFNNISEEQLSREYTIELMCQVNRQLVSDYQDRYRRMFEELLALEDGAFLINCTAGKDRTGFGAALILSALGVPQDIVVQDYLLSARHYKPTASPAAAEKMAKKYGERALKLMRSEAVRPIAEVRAEYLTAAFDSIDEGYGSLANFLERAYGVGERERALLRERLTV